MCSEVESWHTKAWRLTRKQGNTQAQYVLTASLQLSILVRLNVKGHGDETKESKESRVYHMCNKGCAYHLPSSLRYRCSVYRHLDHIPRVTVSLMTECLTLAMPWTKPLACTGFSLIPPNDMLYRWAPRDTESDIPELQEKIWNSSKSHD